MKKLELQEMACVIGGGERCTRGAIGVGLAIVGIGFAVVTGGAGGVLVGAIAGIMSASSMTGCRYNWK